jgi:1-phosphofructokinase family hexose kinase
MFLCVSMNAAVDWRLKLPRLQPGAVNRVTEASAAPGGKAAHVAMVLQTLGANPTWLGFAGGTTGKVLVEGLREMGIHAEAVPTAGLTRMNLEIIDESGTVTEVLEPGPCVSRPELQSMEETFERLLAGLTEDATVLLSGSLPPGVPRDYYATLISRAHKHGSRAFLDTSGEPLKLALRERPDFVKPNQEEAESLTGSPIQGPPSAGNTLHLILQAGAAAVAISLGAQGLLFRSARDGDSLFARVPEQPAQSCVGSGDATLAGFAFAAAQGLDAAESLRLAAACGAANCLADGPGRARSADIMRLKEEIRIEKLARFVEG